jgi:hypothetical protein
MHEDVKILKFETPEDIKRKEALAWSGECLSKSDSFFIISKNGEGLEIIHHGFSKYHLIALMEIFKSELINGELDDNS